MVARDGVIAQLLQQQFPRGFDRGHRALLHGGQAIGNSITFTR